MDPVQSDTGGFLRAASNDDVLRFRASTDMVDRHRSIVDQDGIDSKHYSGAFLWGHDSTGGMLGGAPKIENQLGKVVKMSRTRFRREDRKMGKATDVDVRFSKVNPFAVLAQGMVREGILGNVSISFIPKHAEKREIEGEEIRVYDKIELLEISLVPVPSNPEAQQLVRAMGLELDSIPDLADLGVQRRKTDTGNWFFSDNQGWRFRMPPSDQELDKIVEQVFQSENRGLEIEDLTDQDLPPDNHGADIRSTDVVSSAVRDWVDAQRSA